MAALSLLITTRVLCNRNHFNLRMAHRENGLRQSFEPDPWRSTASLPLSPGPSPFVSLPSLPIPFLLLPSSPRTSLAFHSQPQDP